MGLSYRYRNHEQWHARLYLNHLAILTQKGIVINTPLKTPVAKSLFVSSFLEYTCHSAYTEL